MSQACIASLHLDASFLSSSRIRNVMVRRSKREFLQFPSGFPPPLVSRWSAQMRAMPLNTMAPRRITCNFSLKITVLPGRVDVVEGRCGKCFWISLASSSQSNSNQSHSGSQCWFEVVNSQFIYTAPPEKVALNWLAQYAAGPSCRLNPSCWCPRG